MQSDQVQSLIEKIAATPGKNEKVALIAVNKDDATLKRVLHAALNPLIKYGVRKFLPCGKIGGEQFNDGTWFLLDILAKRECTGNAALDAIKVEMERLTPASATLLGRIILGDLRAGFEASTTNKAIPKLIPVFPYMRCSLPKDMKLDEANFGWSGGVISQEKADGMYLNVEHEVGGIVNISSRQGTQYPTGALDAFIAAIQMTLAPGTQTHGEMVVMKLGKILPREEGNGILNHIAAGGDFAEDEVPVFFVWDQIPLSAAVPKGKYEVAYIDRLANLISQLKKHPDPHIRLIPTKVVHSMKEAWDHYREMLALGKEGTVFKKRAAIWRDGTSKEQGKLKLKAPVELRIKGFNEGTGKFVGQLGSFACESECGKLKVNVSGRGDKMRADVWAAKDDWLDAILCVEANAIMQPSDSSEFYSLFLPIVVERRMDKTVADTLEQIQAQFEAAIAAA